MSETLTEESLRFVLARSRAEHERERPRCYGRSSDALVLYALGARPRPQTPGWSDGGTGFAWRDEECGTDYPYDEADLAACELTYAMAPEHLRERMAEVMEEFRAWGHERRNRYGSPFPYAKGDPA